MHSARLSLIDTEINEVRKGLSMIGNEVLKLEEDFLIFISLYEYNEWLFTLESSLHDQLSRIQRIIKDASAFKIPLDLFSPASLDHEIAKNLAEGTFYPHRHSNVWQLYDLRAGTEKLI